MLEWTDYFASSQAPDERVLVNRPCREFGGIGRHVGLEYRLYVTFDVEDRFVSLHTPYRHINIYIPRVPDPQSTNQPFSIRR